MNLSFKYRIYPNQSQRLALGKIFYANRWLYNSALEERISYYEKFGRGIFYNAQRKELPAITSTFPEFDIVYSQTAQCTLKQLDRAYQNFFRRIKKGETPGFPRFKNKERFRSICFPQVKPDLSGRGGIKKVGDKIQVFGIETPIKVKWHRPWEGKIKQARITYKAGKYHLVLSCADVPEKPLHKTGNEVAFDLGLDSFITLNDGSKIHHPKPYKTSKEKLAYDQQKLAKKQKGSKNSRRLKNQIAKQQEHIANIRDDWQHKLANEIVANNDVIYIDDLDVAGMMKGTNEEKKAKAVEYYKLTGKWLPFADNNSITDAAWGMFILLLIYKAERAGRLIFKVPPKNTSKRCSHCGHLQDMPLDKRQYLCGYCGFSLDRDWNSALNILWLGRSLARGQTLSEATL